MSYILVVDDDRGVRESLGAVLEDEGHATALASNGQDALDVVKQRGRPRLIILDMVMPVMNGSEFRAKQVADARLADVPVIILAGDEHPSADPRSGCQTLRKPVRLEILLSAIDAAC